MVVIKENTPQQNEELPCLAFRSSAVIKLENFEQDLGQTTLIEVMCSPELTNRKWHQLRGQANLASKIGGNAILLFNGSEVCSVDIAALDSIRAVWFVWKTAVEEARSEVCGGEAKGWGWAAGSDCSAEATIDDDARTPGFWTWTRSWEVAFHQLAYQIEGSSQGWWVERVRAEVGRRGLGSGFARLVLNRGYFTTKNIMIFSIILTIFYLPSLAYVPPLR